MGLRPNRPWPAPPSLPPPPSPLSQGGSRWASQGDRGRGSDCFSSSPPFSANGEATAGPADAAKEVGANQAGGFVHSAECAREKVKEPRIAAPCSSCCSSSSLQLLPVRRMPSCDATEARSTVVSPLPRCEIARRLMTREQREGSREKRGAARAAREGREDGGKGEGGETDEEEETGPTCCWGCGERGRDVTPADGDPKAGACMEMFCMGWSPGTQ